MKTGDRKILVVDDNREFVNFIRRALEDRAYQISVAFDGKTAIEKALLEVPELVLLDLKLPDLSGEEVLQRVKEINKNIAIIVITGHGGEQVAVEMMKRGAIDFISKPVEYDVLLKAIENALEMRDHQLEDHHLNRYASLEKFFPFLAHEIRNPLHAISGALAIIQRRSDRKDELLGQSIKIIHEEVQHLNNFVQECLNFVRPPDRIRFNEVDMNELMGVVITMVSHMLELESNNIRVVSEMDPHLPKIYANYEEMKHALVNIVKNAFESMPEGGELTIQTLRNVDSPKHIKLIVSDQGMGMMKENLKLLFSPFFTTKLRGTGLGLAICRRIIVERHHGKIDIESEEHRGTTVRIELPIGRRLGDK